MYNHEWNLAQPGYFSRLFVPVNTYIYQMRVHVWIICSGILINTTIFYIHMSVFYVQRASFKELKLAQDIVYVSQLNIPNMHPFCYNICVSHV